MKVARLLLFPLQVAGAFQDRVERMLERIRNRVPEDRRIEAPAELVGPALEQMRYVDDRSDLWKMFEEVLTKSVDKDQASTVHPSFTLIIPQLSRDEAWILYRLRERPFNVTDKLDLNASGGRFENRVIESSELPVAELCQPDQLDLYYSHLESLSLVTWPVLKEEPIRNGQGRQTGIRRHSKMQLTEFGRLFATASIPISGFEPLKRQSNANRPK
jgi:hypothetical protein